MKLARYFFLITTLVFIDVSAQNFSGVQVPTQNYDDLCSTFKKQFRSKPREVRFNVSSEAGELFFQINYKDWTDKLLGGSNDGFMIDIVSKDRYNCDFETLDKSNFGVIGLPQKPVYYKTIKKSFEKQSNGLYRVKVGNIPPALKNQNLEFNIYFFKDNNLCMYNRIFNLESYGLDLLDMGMYMNELTYMHDVRKPSTTKEDGYQLKYKTLQFIIPFDKNKSTYSAADIKPVYDSLHLTDFDIKKIKIEAYSSVEGSLENNTKLQEARASSIASAMQEFQKPTLQTEITASENWVEFLKDIKSTSYTYFEDLSKKEIKEKLRKSKINEDLEPYLSNHRKALITLSLQKKDPYKTYTSEKIIALFNEAVNAQNIKEAFVLQNIIFERIRGKTITPDYIDKLEVPAQLKPFTDLAMNNSTMKYLINEKEVLRTYTVLKKLDKTKPRNKKIKYNICAIKFKIWRYRVEPVDTNAFRKEILALINYKVSQKLIDRMLINYEILKSESAMRKRDFARKDKSMDYIFNQYKSIPLHDYDYLNLAQYFSNYGRLDSAINLLKDKVVSIDADEDLLFYYLNLTLINKKLTAKPEYRTMILNSISKNKTRFCKLFNSSQEKGVTFQLLENDFLRKNYCENCAGTFDKNYKEKGLQVVEQ